MAFLLVKKYKQVVVIVFLLTLMGALLAVVNQRFLQGTPMSYRNTDFMSLWGGGKAVLSGVNPYEPGVWPEWRVSLGSEWIPDQQAPFPLWTLMVMTPISAMSMGWGIAVWQAVSQVLLGVCIWLLVQTMAERPLGPLLFGLILLTAFLMRGVILTLGIGQITLVLLFVLTLYLYLSHRGHPFSAGVALAFVLLKPNPFVLFVPLYGLWLLAQQRWREIAGGFVGTLLLFAASWLVFPGWIFGWLDVRGKTEYAFINPTLWGLSFELSPRWWPIVGLGITLVLAVGLGWLFLTQLRVKQWQAFSLALTTSLFVSPYAWAYEHALLLIPIAFLFVKVEKRWLAWFFWFFLTLIWPWYLFEVARQRNLDTYSALVTLVVGVVVLGVMWWQLRSESFLDSGLQP